MSAAPGLTGKTTGCAAPLMPSAAVGIRPILPMEGGNTLRSATLHATIRSRSRFLRILRLALVLGPGVGLLFHAAPGRADEETVPLWPDVVDTLEVLSTRETVRERLDLRPGFSTLIPLGPEVSASRDLSDLVDRLAGVHVHRYGGLGAFSTASVRGSSAAQVRVLLDGVPLASARDGVSNLGLIPLSLLDHAIVHRGAQTLSLSGPPAAGVVELETPPAAATPPVIGIASGSHDTQSFRGLWGQAHGPWSFLLAGERRSTAGDFSYLDRNGTPNNEMDDHTVRRRNNDHLDESILFKSSIEPHRWFSLDYTGQRSLRDGGVPGTESIQTTTTRYRTERVRHQARAECRPALPASQARWGRATVHTMIFRDAINDRFTNPNGEVGLSRADEEGEIRTLGGELGLEIPLVPWGLRVQALHGWDRESWTPHDLLHDLSEFTRERKNESTAVSGSWRGLADRVTIEAGYRWDRATDNYGGPIVFGHPPEPSEPRTSRFQAPTLGARLSLGGGLSLHANRGKYLRQPTFPELFGENGVQDGNPALRPEQGLEWDAGVRLRRSEVQTDLAYFENSTRNEILLLQNSQRTVKAHNIDRTWVRGIEASAFVVRPLPHDLRIELETQATWQEAFDRGESRTYRGKEIPYLPEVETYSALRLRGPDWGADYGVAIRSSVFRDRYNSEEKKAPGQALHRIGLERDLFSRRATLRLEIENLWDRRSEDIEGYPLPGRSLFFELILRPLHDRKEVP